MSDHDQNQQQPSKVKAIIALVLGILAMTVPVPIIDVVFGVAGIVLANMAKKEGVGGIAKAAFIVSIIGTVIAVLYTIGVLALGVTI